MKAKKNVRGDDGMVVPGKSAFRAFGIVSGTIQQTARHA
jgi:hypothetical protein